MSVSTFFKLYKWYQLRNASHIVFVVVFESLQHINLEFLFLTLNIYLLPSYIIKVRKHLAFWERVGNIIMKQLVSQWHLFKVNNENTRTTCEIGKGTWATSMTGFTHCFDVSVVDFEQVNTVLVVSI